MLVLANQSEASPPCQPSDTIPAQTKIELLQMAQGFHKPVGLYSPPDGSKRLFVVEQGGTIRIIKQTKPQLKPFLDLSQKISAGGEKGLLGLAFHPKFKENGRFFVNYTRDQDGLHSIISEFRVSKKNPDAADSQSEKILLQIKQPYGNHNGGQIAFGLDGMLYIGTGDGGSGNDPHNHGQNLSSLLGKMLKISVDNRSKGLAYGLPDDNPFLKKKGVRPEIWAYGLRNPWRFSFDPLTGQLWAADVGQRHREEINIIKKGKNYGWRIMEGKICTPGVNRHCDSKGLEPPLHDYPRSEGTAIIGGFVYRGQNIPDLCGAYVYGDYGSGQVWALRYKGRTVTQPLQLLNAKRPITSFGQDQDHELYVVEHSGNIYRLSPQP